MKYDEIVDCPKSGGDLCYRIEINKEITNYMSLSCGFWTNTLMKEGSEFYNEQIEFLPEIYKDLAWKDPKTDLIWLPNTINLPEQGMLFASGPDKDNWAWGAVKAVEIPEEDREKYKLMITDIIKNVGRGIEMGKIDVPSALTNLAEALRKLESAKSLVDKE